jgi:hypothetical protein
MKLVKLIPISLILAFSIIGFLLSGNIIHELSHKYDFREIEKTSENTCFLTLSGKDVAFYEFSSPSNNSKEINKINQYTEVKAYSLDIILALIYFFSLIIVIKSILTK